MGEFVSRNGVNTDVKKPYFKREKTRIFRNTIVCLRHFFYKDSYYIQKDIDD